MKILIKGASLIKKEPEHLERLDVLIQNGEIIEIGESIKDPETFVIEASGKILVPGLVDVHVHFREPGQEHKEDLQTGSRAAAIGGFTTVIAEPNTTPTIDTPRRLQNLKDLAKKKSLVNFFSKAAITQGIKGERLSRIGKLKEAGARAISDDGNPIPTQRLMRHALMKGKEFKILVNPHCEESPLYRERMLKRVSREVTPYTSEAYFIQRDIELAEIVGGRIHFSHVSLAQSVEIIAKAKKRGVQVTAEATPHHLLLNEKMAKEIGPNAKVNPPLRSEEDVSALREGLVNGTIDIIASDHAPHTPDEKNRSWEEAPFGIIGLETTLGLILTFFVKPGILTLGQAIKKMTTLPARIFGLDSLGIGELRKGGRSDLILIDLEKKWRVDANRFYSKGRNCPYNGWELQGKAVLTIVGGRIVAKDGVIIEDESPIFQSSPFLSGERRLLE